MSFGASSIRPILIFSSSSSSSEFSKSSPFSFLVKCDVALLMPTIPASHRFAFLIIIYSISILVVCFTISISPSVMLSVLSELPAAKIVIPFKMVTTNSVFRLVVRNVFRFASYTLILENGFFLRHPQHKILLIFAATKRSLSLCKAIKNPEKRIKTERHDLKLRLTPMN
jgi:hypothetical protein